MQSKPAFYFFNERPAIRFHIASRLLDSGWERAKNKESALFSDVNLILNDEISTHFEYKHLLAQLAEKYFPDIIPTTYSINESTAGEVFAKIIYNHYLGDNQDRQSQHLKWILKPSMQNNGDNIKLFNHIDEVKAHYASPHRLGGDHVLQQYLTNPKLIKGRKFTIRIPVVLTNDAGVFVYKQGYINISAYPFDLYDGFINRKAHITNYVLDGELSHIEQALLNSLENSNAIYQQCCQIVSRAVRGLLKLAPCYLAPQKTKIFEIFGFDFILDQNDKVWLLEINQGPDAPTFEENRLNALLWDPFWQNIISDFVLPIAFNQPPQMARAQFSQVLVDKEVYSRWRHVLSLLRL